MTRLGFRLWGWSLAGASVLTILSTTQIYAGRVVEGLPANWPRLARSPAVEWYTWALLAPVVFLLADTIPRRAGGKAATAVWWVGAGIGFIAIHGLLEVIIARWIGFVDMRMPFMTMLPARIAGTVASSLVVFAGLGLGATLARHSREARAREMQEAELRTQLAQSRLQGLETQLHPHFFFNTLHTVSALMGEDVAAARRVLADLGDLLRESLARVDSHELRLADELAFLEKYLAIERIRFRDRLRIEVDRDPALDDALVPSLVLQPLVENALRHAIAPRATPGRIWVRTFREGDLAHLEVEDDGPGLPEPPVTRKGVGLSNTRARLIQLYGAAARMELTRGAGGGLLARIVLPYHTTAGSLSS